MVDDQTSVRTIRESYRPPYTMVKLMLSNSGNGLPLFRLFDEKDDGPKEDIQLDNHSDVTKHMRCMTKHRVIIEVQKLYTMKTNSGSHKCKCGITIKLVAAERTIRGEVMIHLMINFQTT